MSYIYQRWAEDGDTIVTYMLEDVHPTAIERGRFISCHPHAVMSDDAFHLLSSYAGITLAVLSEVMIDSPLVPSSKNLGQHLDDSHGIYEGVIIDFNQKTREFMVWIDSIPAFVSKSGDNAYLRFLFWAQVRAMWDQAIPQGGFFFSRSGDGIYLMSEALGQSLINYGEDEEHKAVNDLYNTYVAMGASDVSIESCRELWRAA